MEVAHGGAYTAVPEQALDGVDIGTRFEQVRGERMAKGMQSSALADADAGFGGLERPADAANGERAFARAAGEQPRFGVGAFGQIIAAQLREQLLREQGVAVFLSPLPFSTRMAMRSESILVILR